MTLAAIVLRNFTVFEDARFDLCPGVNVLLGANGTGKTHAMKAAYVAAISRRGSPDFFDRLAGVFLPERRNPGRLVRRPLGEPPHHAELRAVDDEGAENLVILGHDGSAQTNSAGRGQPAIYMPSRDVFSTFEGLIGADRKRALSFDETFFDLCVALDAPPAEDVAPGAAPIRRRLEEILGGEVVREGNRFYVRSAGGEKVEAHLVAEGLRKIATLVRLVASGAIAPGTTVFWDTPETGLEPTLVARIGEVIGELARFGVQVVVATHDASLSSRLAQMAGQVPVRCFNLVRDGQDGPVRVTASDAGGVVPRLLVNIDVPDVAAAVEFYGRAFGFTVGRRFGDAAVELLGAGVPVYLLAKAAGSAAASTTAATRDYARHWTPVHLDIVVDDLDAALARAQAAGASIESPVREASWGSMALLADPWGHGFCILKFTDRGYDAIAT
jgi:predicted enzyme related to lactoylglutathione lyase